MARRTEDDSGAGLTTIKPARIELTTSAPAGREPTRWRGVSLRRVLLLAGFAVSLASAAAVVFVLPKLVPAPSVESGAVSTPAATNAAKATPRAASSPPSVAESPWERAQQSELRSQTQDLLAEMLDAKTNLDQHAVKVWGEKEYRQALEFAAKGDEHYRAQEFAEALEQYSRAHEVFEQLVDRIDPVFEEYLSKGNQALEEGDSKAATAAFQAALAIDSLDRAASAGLARAGTLDEVVARLTEGDRFVQADQLEAALASYEAALALDGDSIQAKEKAAQTRERIAAAGFNREMSSGFAFLESGQPEKAKQAFSSALRVKPGSREATSALEQAANQLEARAVKSLLAQAAQAETDEQWHEARSHYQAALELDPHLSVARSGRDRAHTRVQIHERLQGVLNNPERLFEQEVYDDTLAFYEKIRSISAPDTVLGRQLDAVSALLKRANTPVSVRLESDNLTKVTLYKVGELGYFETKELSLRPGRYVAVGNREGYRDVRAEFFVVPSGSVQTITIRATERIDGASARAG
jgi:tetratricopeptide (TPR) repeat protein